MQTSVVSFGYKFGLPLDVDLVFDCRFLPNPFWIEELRPFSGLDAPVRDYVLSQPEATDFLEKVDGLLTGILPSFVREGKSYLTIAAGVHGGPAPLGDPGRGAGRAVRRARPPGVRLPSGRGAVTPTRRVVALGGGHGTAVTLHAARRYAGLLTAVVSVADDGGSSGRLREILNVVALGDLRKCLIALAAPRTPPLARPSSIASTRGSWPGHALGNLILAGLVEATGDLVSGVRAAADLLGAAGDVLPATTELVVLKAESDSGQVAGQVAVSRAGNIQHGVAGPRRRPGRRPWPSSGSWRPTRSSSGPGRSSPACWPRPPWRGSPRPWPAHGPNASTSATSARSSPKRPGSTLPHT